MRSQQGFDFGTRTAHESSVTRRIAWIFFLGASACALEIPEGPDLSQLAAGYERPDGALNEENVREVAEAAQRAYEDAKAFVSIAFVMDTLSEVGDAVAEFSDADAEHPLKVKLVGNTEAICPGNGDREPDDPKNGTLKLTLTVEHSKINPTVWGRFNDCQLAERDGLQVTVDSDIAVYIDGNLNLSALSLESYLFRIDGKAESNRGALQGELDFRLFQDGSLEVRVPAEEGHIITTFGVLGEERAAVRTRNRSYCCYFNEQRCLRISGDSCSDAAQGDEELSW